ncbi:MAG: PhoU domain-containing protein [Acidilobaceae archaeon]
MRFSPITVRPEPKLSSVKLSKVVDLRSGLDVNAAMREVVSAYISGYETFTILFDDGSFDNFKTLRVLLESKLSGLIPVDEKGDRVIYKVVSAPKPLSVKDATSWMYRLVNAMFSDLIKGVKSGDHKFLDFVIERDDLVDRAYFMIVKNVLTVLLGGAPLESIGVTSNAETLHYYHTFKTMERVADHLAGMARSFKELKADRDVLEDLAVFLDKCMEVFSEASESIIKLDVDRARRAASKAETLKVEWSSLFKSMSGIGDFNMDAILLSLNRILAYSIDLAEIVYDINATKSVTETIYGD